VACMVNGAGLAMATMDIIKYAGGSPANFLDVGGGASADQVKKCVWYFNGRSRREGGIHQYFGGILRCDVLASGVVAAAKDLQLKVPVVVRMEEPTWSWGENSARQRTEFYDCGRHERWRAKSSGPGGGRRERADGE